MTMKRPAKQKKPLEQGAKNGKAAPARRGSYWFYPFYKVLAVAISILLVAMTNLRIVPQAKTQAPPAITSGQTNEFNLLEINTRNDEAVDTRR